MQMARKAAPRAARDAVVVPFDDRDAIRRLEALDHGVGFLVRTTHRMFWRALDRQFAEFGITPEMWTYLRVIWHEEGLSLREIAERLKLEGPTVGTAVKIMEKRGLIVRKRNRQDGREWRIYLRARGRSLKRKLLAIAERNNTIAQAGLTTDQLEILKSGLLQMQKNLTQRVIELEGGAESDSVKRRAM
jgi:MarR family transcriptional regulator, organic hydroperoxide resistance regulator